MLTVSSISLLQYGTAQTMEACRQRRELHRCFVNFESMAAKPNVGGEQEPASHGQSRTVPINKK